jgi:hypothetical protein
VAPGLIFFTAVFGSMPGIGVPPGVGDVMTALFGMPGVEFTDGGIGEVENSGGNRLAF